LIGKEKAKTMVYGLYCLHELVDYEMMKKYVEKVRGTVEQYGGQYLATDPNVEVIEGTWTPLRTVIVASTTREALGSWWDPPEYRAILPYRLKRAKGTAIVVHGVE
jgi:uncharacterized protein (DUF1330 family)